MTWSLPEPMLTVAVDNPAQPAGWAAEPKLSTGFFVLAIANSASLPRPRRLHRAVLDCQGALSVEAGTVVLRSRRGSDMRPAFPEIMAAAGRLPDATAIDCVM
jgi:hypothetical protein